MYPAIDWLCLAFRGRLRESAAPPLSASDPVCSEHLDALTGYVKSIATVVGVTHTAMADCEGGDTED